MTGAACAGIVGSTPESDVQRSVQMAGTITAEEVAGNRPSSCAGRHRRVSRCVRRRGRTQRRHHRRGHPHRPQLSRRSAAPPSASPVLAAAQAVPSDQEISMTTDQHTRRRPAIWRAVRGVAAALRTLHRENTLGSCGGKPTGRPSPAPAHSPGSSPSTATSWPAATSPPHPAPPPETRYERRLRSNSLLSRQDMWSGLGCSSGSLALTLKRGHADPPAQLHQDRN